MEVRDGHWLSERCPRCKGNLYLVNEIFETVAVCCMCARSFKLSELNAAEVIRYLEGK